MTSLDKAIIAHLDYAGERFEILVDPELAQAYKTGQKKELNNVLVVDEVFKNSKTSERHKSSKLQEVFHTTDVQEIAKAIFERGELQLTTDQKKKMVEEKRKQVIALIAREAVDPRTHAPIPVLRIENALEQVRVNIDPFKPAQAQMKEFVDALRPVLPIKFEHVRIAVKVPPQHASRSYGTLKQYTIQKEEWTGNGSLIVIVELPAGLQGEFFDRINKITSGDVETKTLPSI
ncbi:ribosome assembly factor SBDS [Candidatus Parvarchaeota archaeon]|nr:ribosome assembly factor SBDS [Candidatus Parvarchaeota archaeon]